METLYSTDIDKELSSKLGITYDLTKTITKAYREYLRYCVSHLGIEVTYVGLVAIRFEGKDHSLEKETFAFQVKVIATELKLSEPVVDRVLVGLKELLQEGIATPGISYNIRGLFTLDTNHGVKLAKSASLSKELRVAKTALFREMVREAA